MDAKVSQGPTPASPFDWIETLQLSSGVGIVHRNAALESLALAGPFDAIRFDVDELSVSRAVALCGRIDAIDCGPSRSPRARESCRRRGELTVIRPAQQKHSAGPDFLRPREMPYA